MNRIKMIIKLIVFELRPKYGSLWNFNNHRSNGNGLLDQFSYNKQQNQQKRKKKKEEQQQQRYFNADQMALTRKKNNKIAGQG